MTPLIDVVFILIVFFMLICQFIVRENVPVEAPDDCENAITELQDSEPVTVSVFIDPLRRAAGEKRPLYAIRARQFDPDSQAYATDSNIFIESLTDEITQLTRHKTKPAIHLRADKHLTFQDVRPALTALAQAGITQVHLAAYQKEQEERE